MKHILLPIVTSTIIIWQLFSSQIFAASGDEDCMALLFWGNTAASGSVTNDACVESLFWSGQTNTSNTGGKINQAETAIQDSINEINNTITDWVTLNAAPTELVNYIYSPWELIHRTAMISGFMWGGEIANFITPAMYVGTPFEKNSTYLGGNNPYSADLTADPTNYDECVQHEAYLSFGLGDLVEDTDIKELKAIAKACAKEHYGTYFEWKKATTREEFLMMLFSMFEEEDVAIQGSFSEAGKFIVNRDESTEIAYTNVNSTDWYASYLKLAGYLNMVDPESETWEIGKIITDDEAVAMISAYTAYRMNFEWETMDKGIITTEKMKYSIAFPSTHELTIKIQ
jgi:hypothetical protein